MYITQTDQSLRPESRSTTTHLTHTARQISSDGI